MLCRRGIAVLVKEAVMEDMSSSTSQVRFDTGHDSLSASQTFAALMQSSAEAARLVEHVDRKLVKQVRATVSMVLNAVALTLCLFSERRR